jgi:hypothetical protein
MNKDLSEVIVYYSTKSHQELNSLLLNKSKDNLISCLIDLLTTYLNDKNSSSLREYLTVILSNKLNMKFIMHSDSSPDMNY